MITTMTGHAPALDSQSYLSDADRALILMIAERELAQGKITVEEYDYLLDQCHVHPGAALVQRVLRLLGRGGVAHFPLGRSGSSTFEMLPSRLETIPVSSIVGSVDRATHLDRRFRPIHGGRARLAAIRQAMAAGEAFEPVTLYRLAGACYVIDSHKRVAAALQLGQLYVDAVVTECWPQYHDQPEPMAAARTAFSRDTGLPMLILGTPANYHQALRHIQDHRWYLGERGQVLSLPEAARDWYQTVYLPALQQLVAEGVAPLRQPAEIGDRYFDLCTLKEKLRREQGRDVVFAEALQVWTARRPWRLFATLRHRPDQVRMA